MFQSISIRNIYGRLEISVAGTSNGVSFFTEPNTVGCFNVSYSSSYLPNVNTTKGQSYRYAEFNASKNNKWGNESMPGHTGTTIKPYTILSVPIYVY